MRGLYEQKPTGYFGQCRTELLMLMPREQSRVLEIGAGCGDTLLKAKELGLAGTIVGVELKRVPGSNQSHPDMDCFLLGDVETMDLDLEPSSFDVILCGDVLEHLTDPWRVVGKVGRFLKPGGIMIASLPNFREAENLLDLVFHGSFRYANAGLRDRTHLRFFCKSDMVELFESNGFRIESIGSDLQNARRGKRRALDRLTRGLFREFLVRQYYLVARKS